MTFFSYLVCNLECLYNVSNEVCIQFIITFVCGISDAGCGWLFLFWSQ